MRLSNEENCKFKKEILSIDNKYIYKSCKEEKKNFLKEKMKKNEEKELKGYVIRHLDHNWTQHHDFQQKSYIRCYNTDTHTHNLYLQRNPLEFHLYSFFSSSSSSFSHIYIYIYIPDGQFRISKTRTRK